MPVFENRKERRRQQAFFNKLGKGYPALGLRCYFPNHLFFEPRFTRDSMGEYLRHFSADSMEIVFHNLFHVTARIENYWYDFHWETTGVPNIICTTTRLNLDKIDSAVAKVRNINSYYGQRKGKDISIGLYVDLSKQQSTKLRQTFDEYEFPVKFDAEGRRGGETCLTLLSRLLQQATPELGVTRSRCSQRLFQALRSNSHCRQVNVYSNAKYSHIKWPLLRLARLALGPPKLPHLLKLWQRSFSTQVPNNSYREEKPSGASA